MPASEDRQAKALEGILGQLTFVNQLLRKLVEVKDLPGLVYNTEETRQSQSVDSVDEAAVKLKNPQGVVELLQQFDTEFSICVVNMHVRRSTGEVRFTGLISDDVNNNGKQIEGIIKDVY
jgi:hypothetical protein